MCVRINRFFIDRQILWVSQYTKICISVYDRIKSTSPTYETFENTWLTESFFCNLELFDEEWFWVDFSPQELGNKFVPKWAVSTSKICTINRPMTLTVFSSGLVNMKPCFPSHWKGDKQVFTISSWCTQEKFHRLMLPHKCCSILNALWFYYHSIRAFCNEIFS